MAMAAKEDVDVVLPIDLGNAHGRAFRSTCLEAARGACPLACCDMCSTMGTLRHEVLAAMRRWLDCRQYDDRRMAGSARRASIVYAGRRRSQTPRLQLRSMGVRI